LIGLKDASIDVLEYIKLEKLGEVIKGFAAITKNLGFLFTHIRLAAYFEILHSQTYQVMGNSFWLIVKPKEILSLLVYHLFP
jgi:hypothetical protein